MAVFTVGREFDLDTKLASFSGGISTWQFMNPEEADLGVIISEQLDFSVKSVLVGRWHVFADKLKGLLTQEQGPPNLSSSSTQGSGDANANKIRVAICSTALLKPELFKQAKGEPKEVNLPMKLKLFSNIHLQTSSRQDREQGCLVKLARLCGTENVYLALFLDVQNHLPRWSLPRYKLSWNEKDMLWETETKIAFKKRGMSEFGKHEGNFTYQLMVQLHLTDAGVNRVLQKCYQSNGNNWRVQQRFLETEAFSDLVLKSNHPKNRNGEAAIKCHRIHLAGASQVFDNMLKESGGLEEAKTQTIKLPESEDTIRAMLHFIYYGSTKRLFGNQGDTLLELLQAGHKYNIPNLVDVTIFMFLTTTPLRFTVEVAVELFCFARNLDGENWNELKMKAYAMLEAKDFSKLKSSKTFQNIYQIAEKLGPVFESILKQLMYRTREEKCVPNALANVAKEEAALLLDFLRCGRDYSLPRNLDVAVGLILLTEYCDEELPAFANRMCKKYFRNGKTYQVDYLVDLFCLTSEHKVEARFWGELKLEAVRKLKMLLIHQPDQMEASAKYVEMFRKNAEVAREFTGLISKVCECAKNRKVN